MTTDSAGARRPCPFCGEEVLAVAKKCKHCQSMFDGSGATELPALVPTAPVDALADRLAVPGRRIGAWLLDLVCFALVGVVGLILGSQSPVVLILAVLVALLIQAQFWSEGTTPGKAMPGMKVYSEKTREPVGFWAMAIRETLGKDLSGALLGLGWIWILIDKRHQGFHDKLLGTVVLVDDKPTADSSRSFLSTTIE